MGLKKLTVRLCHLVAMEGKGTEFLKVKVWKGIGRRRAETDWGNNMGC